MASLLKFIYRWCFERIKNTTFFFVSVFAENITMETTDTTVTDLRCVEVADVAEVVLIEEQTQRIQLIRNM